jgi:uncharacterized membrane protein YphA (DoxX/SURF4 family)
MIRIAGIRPALLILRLCVAGYFVAAGFIKIAARHEIVGTNPTTMLAAFVAGRMWVLTVLAVLEILVGCWLLTGVWTRYSSIVTIVLLSSFTGLLFAESRRPIPKPCGCAAAASTQPSQSETRESLSLAIGRNAAMMLFCSALFVVASDGKKKPR